MNPHPYTQDELAAGRALAESFLARLLSHEAVESDGLAQAIELSRMGSLARMRAFAARVQQHIVEAARDAN
jgi:hypothetical protein